MLSLKTILVPVDFNDPSDTAIAAAIDLARMTDARLVLVHAWEAPWAYADTPMIPLNDVTLEIGKAARAAAELKLREVQTKWSRTSTVVRQGAAWQVVIDVITEEKCDLVVMGTHGRTGLAHALLGSVAEKVVRLSPVPVLTVRGPRAGHTGGT
jgi:nucleotide-binding universal stress UspA family protein